MFITKRQYLFIDCSFRYVRGGSDLHRNVDATRKRVLRWKRNRNSRRRWRRSAVGIAEGKTEACYDAGSMNFRLVLLSSNLVGDTWPIDDLFTDRWRGHESLQPTHAIDLRRLLRQEIGRQLRGKISNNNRWSNNIRYRGCDLRLSLY